MELGPIQKKWIEALRAHPERQLTGQLGWVNKDDEVRACCLGQAKLILDGKPEGTQNIIVSDDDCDILCSRDYHRLGLRDGKGSFKNPVKIDDNKPYPYRSLIRMNDNLVPWPKIADFMENNPELVFIESK